MTAMWAVCGVTTAIFSALVCCGLIVLLRPLLLRYALAKPNARSSHREPTPQGGGIAVIAATIATTYLATTYLGTFGLGVPIKPPPITVVAAVVLIACVGAVDDLRTIAVIPRLFLQALTVAIVIYALPAEIRIVAAVPWWLERLLVFLAYLWFVNLVNFMDGIDWMTVAEVVPIAGAVAAIGYLGALPGDAVIAALALCGAMIGFAPFNRPVAMLFLGDVGSLPIGLLLGWLLVRLAGGGHLAAAILLPLYYLADATITLLRRALRSEPIWQAHRTHFYQIATERGFSVTGVVVRVFLVNVGLCALAILTVVAPGRPSDIGALVGGSVLVALLLAALAKGRS
jgi:UDP-N-acetylmuramyl pentapeptide phosphotransferase/UDP-N-acetylglucosamine-1-phosphate transferase